MNDQSKAVAARSRWCSPMFLARRFVGGACRSGIVQGGVFAGMRYMPRSSFISHEPVLLGTYELELAEVTRRVAAGGSGPLINIGAAEGYYAVGLARLAPHRRVIAFEMDEKGRSLIRENAVLNHVAERVEVRGRCERAELEALLAAHPDAAVFMDVEGAEAEMLFGDRAAWCRCTLVVETHEFVHRGITARIQQFFAATHESSLTTQRERCWRDLPGKLPARRLLWRWYRSLLSERRPEPMCWLCLTPRSPA